MTYEVRAPVDRNPLTEDETRRLEQLAGQKTLAGYELGEAHALLIRGDWATQERLAPKIRGRREVKRS